MRIIGLSGPSAAGKDAVAKILKRRGAHIIDTDQVAHGLYAFQSPLWHELVRAFGSKILKRGGKINRQKLGEIVFGDKKKLLELNKIVHPYLKEAIIKKAESCKSLVSCKLIVINAALLKEIGLIDHVDEVWVVSAPKDVRLKRLMRAGLLRAEAIKRINAQAAQKEYLNIAALVINNDGTLKQLKRKVERLQF